YLVFANTVAVVSLQYPVLRLAQRFPALASLKAGSIMFGLGLMGFGLFQSLVPLIIAMTLFALGEILCFIMAEMVINQ
ncbi:hypothetical protein MXD81_27125, partial [Microbacteriaceae bacterium K1510]|nr:hypothetical protein [Microbacteriaceae bacterium K1510]